MNKKYTLLWCRLVLTTENIEVKHKADLLKETEVGDGIAVGEYLLN